MIKGFRRLYHASLDESTIKGASWQITSRYTQSLANSRVTFSYLETIKTN